MKYLPLILGLACILGASYQLYRNTRLRLAGQSTEGVVIRNEKSTGKSTVYYPIVQFTAVDGKTYTCKGQSGTYPAEYDVNDTIPVHYDPADPTRAFIGSFLGMLSGVLMSLGLGTLFTAFGFRILRRNRTPIANSLLA